MTGRPVYIALATPPRAWVSNTHTPETLPTVTVHVENPAPRATGLVTAQGTPIYRVTERAPVGFCRD